MKYRDFVDILKEHGFDEVRTNGRHRLYEGFVGGRRCLVTAAFSQGGEDIEPKNLASMIRQSGLPKSLFRGG